MAKQFLMVHDASFASRPPLAAGKYTSYNYRDLVWTPHGPYWRQTRRIYSYEVFNTKKLELYEQMLSRDEHFSEGDSVLNMDELHKMLDEWFLLSGVFNIGDWIPWLSPFDLQGYVKKMKALNKKMDKFYNYVIDDHLA
ncbi:hypothetical protein SASPL_150334 [Salvia splendens]|uniref:Flavonoid 3'-monooxygenase n=1 Tax=Salvia splendens TaxID=180675 RepID=A0A8X8W608_SALSN|nr:hypothetical protein SASPL_150334 [Salvia splendens]